MQRILMIAAVLAVFGSAFALYVVKTDTRDVDERVRKLSERVETLRSTIAVESAELANLSRPDRLDALLKANPNLKLQPMRPDQFGAIEDIPFRSDLAAGAPASEIPVEAGGKPQVMP